MQVATWLSELTYPTPVDPSDIEELRHDLDVASVEALGSATRSGGLSADELPLRVPKSRIADLDRCERSAVASATSSEARSEPMNDAMLRGIALDQFVMHQIVAGLVREPLADLRSMLLVAGEWEPLALLDDLDDAAGAELLDPLAAAAAASWAEIGTEWAPRTQSRASVVLADADVVCSSVVDVELGGPTTALPSVVIEVKSGRPSSSHQAEAYLYALLVALRDRAAPVNVARWYPDAPPAGTPVTIGVLESAARRLGDSIGRWAELSAGRTPEESPGRWCTWCADNTVCPSAQSAPSDAAAVAGTADEMADDGW